MNFLNNMIEVNDVINKDIVMIIAKTHTCSACQTILNVLEHNVSNLDQIDIYNIYIDDVDEFRGQHTIFSVPTVLIFSEGKELLRESRYINYSKIERLISMFKD
jgi:thiol-disulfide isomerase/thioredoxin